MSIEVANNENTPIYKDVFKSNQITIDLKKSVLSDTKLADVKYSKIVFTVPDPKTNIVLGELIFIGADNKIIPPSELFAAKAGKYGEKYVTSPATFVTKPTERTKTGYYQNWVADMSFYQAYVMRQSDKPNASVNISFSEKVKPPIMIKRMLLFTPSHGKINTKDTNGSVVNWTESIKGMKISWYNGDTLLHTMQIPQSVPKDINNGVGNYVDLSPTGGARYISREEFISLLNGDKTYIGALTKYEKEYVKK